MAASGADPAGLKKDSMSAFVLVKLAGEAYVTRGRVQGTAVIAAGVARAIRRSLEL
jgi:hypothetical protein